MDSEGRAIWRLLPYLLPFAMFVGAWFVTSSAALSALIFGGIALFNVIGLLPRRQMAMRNVELELGPGYVQVKKGGTRNQKITAKDLTGGTSARTKSGFVFTMQHRKRNQPVLLEVDSEDELSKVRQALGVGHSGFGTVAWATQSDSNARTAWTGRAIALGCILLMWLFTAGIGNEAAVAFDILLGMVGAVAQMLGFAGATMKKPAHTVVMSSDGLRLFTPRGWFSLPYAMLAGIQEHARGLLFEIAPPHPPVGVEKTSALVYGLNSDEQKALVAQITSASQRARGLGPQKDDIRGRVETLRRGGDNARSWLQRLDMAGEMLASGGAGYRGQTLDIEDLWTILEDPEAEPELRAGAARVLKHAPQPETRARIDAAIAAVREEKANKKIRIAIKDDVEEAAVELATVDYEPPRPMYVDAYGGPRR